VIIHLSILSSPLNIVQQLIMKKNLWIVGGGSAIGNRLTEKLSAQYQIISLHRRAECMTAVADEIHEAIDLADPDKLLDPITRLSQLYPPSGIIFGQRYRPLVEFADHFSLALKTEVQSSAKIVEILQQLEIEQLSSVVFLTSVNHRLINKQLPLWYHLSKSAQVSLVKYLSVAKESQKYNVNAIELGSFLKYPLSEYSEREQHWFRTLKEHNPMNQLINLDQLADFAAFLISDAASVINGQIMSLDGGISNIFQETLIG
jgi:NAD(P)-dependent dehydrogenase (short-subunit alcohol dehydrogenase family)